MREIKFSQTHRTTGARRRFIISQFDPTPTAVAADQADGGPYLANGEPAAWHYTAQTGSDTPWTNLRRLDVPIDAPDEEVRKKATRDLSRRARKRDRQ